MSLQLETARHRAMWLSVLISTPSPRLKAASIIILWFVSQHKRFKSSGVEIDFEFRTKWGAVGNIDFDRKWILTTPDLHSPVPRHPAKFHGNRPTYGWVNNDWAHFRWPILGAGCGTRFPECSQRYVDRTSLNLGRLRAIIGADQICFRFQNFAVFPNAVGSKSSNVENKANFVFLLSNLWKLGNDGRDLWVNNKALPIRPKLWNTCSFLCGC